MPEKKAETPLDPEMASLSDFLPDKEDKKESESAPEDKTEESKPDTADDKGDDSEEELTELEIDDEVSPPGDDLEDDDADQPFAIDEKLRAKLDEEETKRLENHLKGAAKVYKQNVELQQKHTVFDSYIQALTNPQTAATTYRYLGEQAASAIGITYDQLLGITPAQEVTPRMEDWEAELIAKANKPVDAKVAALEAKIAAMEKSDAERVEAQKFDTYLKIALPKTQQAIAKRYPGFKVTRDTLRDAVKAFPDLRTRPWDAVKRYAGADIADHMLKAPQKKVKPHDMIESATRDAKPLPDDPSELTLEHFR